MVSVPRNDFEPLRSSSLRLRVSYWILTNFTRVRRWAIVGLAAACVLLYGWSAWQAIPIIRDPHLVSRIAAEVSAVKLAIPTPPKQLELGEVAAVSHQRGADFVATISNPNDSRIALDVRYSFILPDGTATPERSLWLMPNETRYAAGFYYGQSDTVGAKLAVTGMRWQRVTAAVPAPSVAVAVEDVSLVPAAAGEPARVNFTLKNSGNLGYRWATVTAVVRQGGQVVAVGLLEVQDLLGGETRSSTVTWYDPIPVGSQAEVEVLANPFDRANLLLPA